MVSLLPLAAPELPWFSWSIPCVHILERSRTLLSITSATCPSTASSLCTLKPSCLVHSFITAALIHCHLSQLQPSFLSFAPKSVSVLILGFPDIRSSPHSSSTISIWNSVQSTLVSTIEDTTQSGYNCGLHQLLLELKHIFTPLITQSVGIYSGQPDRHCAKALRQLLHLCFFKEHK